MTDVKHGELSDLVMKMEKKVKISYGMILKKIKSCACFITKLKAYFMR
jgi:hypothetical protein